MKLFVLAVLCTLSVAVQAGLTSKEKNDALLSIANACLTETGASQADLDAMIKHQAAPNTETKCLRACVMKKLNIMTSNGKFDKEVALKLAELHTEGNAEKMQIAKEIGEACVNIPVPDDHCEAAEMYKMCLFGEARKHGIKIEDE